jgi:hypothetical protein
MLLWILIVCCVNKLFLFKINVLHKPHNLHFKFFYFLPPPPPPPQQSSNIILFRKKNIGLVSSIYDPPPPPEEGLGGGGRRLPCVLIGRELKKNNTFFIACDLLTVSPTATSG